MIIETSDNRLFTVRETGERDLSHVWYGTAVKRSGGGYVPKVGAREELVRKAACKIVAAGAVMVGES